MKTLQAIKDEVSQEVRKKRDAPFLRNYDSRIHSRTHLIEIAMDEVAKRYALEVAKEALKNAYAGTIHHYFVTHDDNLIERPVLEDLINNENNIPELI